MAQAGAVVPGEPSIGRPGAVARHDDRHVIFRSPDTPDGTAAAKRMLMWPLWPLVALLPL